MYLKSLTLRGFKSFASATTLNFEPGITCVVGPNGSGKSNVVDALAWVMGAQAAKSLRGGKMEDVIFAGTSGRAPLGRAEVALTIDNTDGALPIEYTEVTISRTMFRNGGSEYAINGNAARLLDVQELLSDSGIGREMHVIVGQGQLDSILQATPEGRRGFIEEAAGVLKHRKRKEKALRKLESTEGNLNRLNDLIGEIRRQLKPLGRQADVARKAVVIQAEVRDARARLLADDLVQATLALESDLADEQALRDRRTRIEESLAHAREAEAEAEEQLRLGLPRLTAAQETWYALSGLRERVSSTMSIAAERVRNASNQPTEDRPGRDPEQLEAEANEVGRQEEELRADVARADEALAGATERRNTAEKAHAAEEQRLAAQLRAIADRREGLARLTGQVNSARSRAEAVVEEIGRLTTARTQALERAQRARAEFTSLETKVAGLDAGEVDLDSEHEEAASELEAVERQLGDLQKQEQSANQERAAAAARLEALKLGLERKDASAALLAATDRVGGLLGQVAALVQVESGFEAAVSAAFGQTADAVAVTGLDAAVGAFDHLKAEDLGRAGLLLRGAVTDGEVWPQLPYWAQYAADVVGCDAELRPSVLRVLRKVAVVDDLPAARRLVADLPDVTAVTRDGDILSAWFAAGGSGHKQSLIEAQAAVDEAEKRLVAADHQVERLRFALGEVGRRHEEARSRLDVALGRLHESDAVMAALAEDLGKWQNLARQAADEAGRLAAAAEKAQAQQAADADKLAELEQRLKFASAEEIEEDADPAERDRLAEVARAARQGEMDARLTLRTTEERVRGLAGRADSLRRAAENERRARARAEARRRQLRREAENARAVRSAAEWLLRRVEISRDLAAVERSTAESERAEADRALADARRRSRELAADLQQLVDSVHRDELARAQQRMRVETLTEKAMAELGLEAETLMGEFGPELPIPVLTRPDGSALTEDDEQPEPVPFVRAEQEKRLRRAEKNLQVLGRVNPLALEEFDAMTERHQFLSEQLDDLRRTRKDLTDIIAEVDNRVQQVFAEAYADVEAAFEQVFAKLFPGGEGRLVLTEPGQWLTTGVDVEARPPGKKVKRLSLLSGGERSLVAVAFLVALFIARPSPFYILDEVEAALDDTNLGRLLEIYQQLRDNSQLLVITHQKRTMEIADALYGVTMRGDGVSTVISQRLHD
ncbi:chromosome segregation protein SMC [Enemella dayhoffiae]|uniref:Chromosome partition protein Smc n=1 Tax=Enemella dayhoffiae TaxID=2016507 RepID=A0A255GRT5_9ACTN|nr:chromosome segregation protein SMC [Enemella dayhoffiae]OYO17316.1 chromosome segregation protein SMC [Enemella dayhoffiae]